jgi:hypothetical protein
MKNCSKKLLLKYHKKLNYMIILLKIEKSFLFFFFIWAIESLQLGMKLRAMKGLPRKKKNDVLNEF